MVNSQSSCDYAKEDVEIKFEESHLIDLQEMIKKSQDLEHPVP